ncbi:MAG TPA: BlaI/MecI/CopY family transcriptional regulator, partial [Candidatus Paceibacterota bacterium]|nr:BlaI/MecI/CopY family transcriptional regulator [Candidatus Paceibacterota bacterium]
HTTRFIYRAKVNSNAEQNIMDVIRTAGRRLVTKEILAALREAHGAASEGTTKTNLASLVRRNLLTNRQDVTPKGYGLPEWE